MVLFKTRSACLATAVLAASANLPAQPAIPVAQDPTVAAADASKVRETAFTAERAGDHNAAAQQVAELTGIEDYRAQMSPQEKMAAVQALQSANASVLMVGDGVNDAPVLSSANVSIAMGGASSLAKTSADIVLIANHLQAVAQAFDMARRTQRVIKQNMIWALLYNFGAIPAAAAGLIAPWLAAIGMSVSSLLVVLNALRLTR